MRDLKLQRVWCVCGSSEGFITKGGAPAVPNDDSTLMPFDEAAELMCRMIGGRWPPAYAVALSLDASGCMSVVLRNAWDAQRASVGEGPYLWTAGLDSYTEVGIAGADGTPVRIIARGTVPEGAVIPRAVLIQTTGFVPMTGDRIPARPAWQGDNGGVIRDCSEALVELLVPKRPQYVSM